MESSRVKATVVGPRGTDRAEVEGGSVGILLGGRAVLDMEDVVREGSREGSWKQRDDHRGGVRHDEKAQC